MNLHREILGLACLWAGWLVLIGALPGAPSGVGWLAFVVLLRLTVARLGVLLELPRQRPWVHLLWCIPGGFAAAVTIYAQPAVVQFGPPLILLSGAVCTMVALRRNAAFEDLAELFGPLARRWGRGFTFLPGAVDSSGLRPAGAEWGPFVRGGALGILMVLVFGGLFCAADSEFSDWVDNLSALVAWEAIDPMLRWAVYGIASAALLLGLALGQSGRRDEGGEASTLAEPTTWTVALMMVNCLFAGFLAVQAPRMFATRMDAGHLAHYAREGFFQLLLCTILVYALVKYIYGNCLAERSLPTLLGLTCLFVAQALGVGASSLHRLWLYSGEFGLTVLRIYAGLGTLSFSLLLCILLAACLLGPGRVRLQAALHVTGALVFLSTALINVEGWVVNSHLGRAGRSLDVGYLSKLSSDAVPALAAGLHGSHAKQCREVLAAMPRPFVAGGLRWNYSRANAARILSRLDGEQPLALGGPRR